MPTDLDKNLVIVQDHWYSCSVQSAEELSDQLLDFCVSIRTMLSNMGAPAEQRCLIWLCLDHGWDARDDRYEKFSLSSIKLRVDTSLSDTRFERHFAQLLITIFNPGTSDVLKPTRQAYRAWLLGEMQRNLVAAFGEPNLSTPLQSVLTRTQIWISGQSEILTFNEARAVEIFRHPLSQSEEALFDIKLVLGPRPGDFMVDEH